MRWNVVLGGIGFFLTLLFSMAHNPWLTTMVRSLYSFIILFLVAFLLRWLLRSIAGLKQVNEPSASPEQGKADVRGQHFDQVTPEDHPLPHQKSADDEQLDSKRQDNFAPLQPPKLMSKSKADAEEVVKAVRHWSEE